MNYRLLSLLLVGWISSNAQNVQWAHELVGFSSERSSTAYTAREVLGVPNAESPDGASLFAWAASKEDGGKEYLHVRFKTGVRAQQVAVFESLNPGAISEITLVDINGKRHEVYKNKDPQIAGMGRSRVFRHYFGALPNPIIEAKIEIDGNVPGVQQIDAIAISDSRTPIEPKINLVSYATQIPNPENLGPKVNSPAADRLPIISHDGGTLWFARKYHPDNLGDNDEDDIWVSKQVAGNQWSLAQNPGSPLNTETHNFVITPSPDGQRLYLANIYKGAAKDGVSMSTWTSKGWSSPKPLDINNMYNNSPYVDYHISVDERVLLMSVQRERGFGDRDIYVSFRQGDGSWSEPLNAGADINTVSMEAGIFLAADMKTLYFCSAGHEGYGGLDLFITQRLDDSWQRWGKPKNIGPKINTQSNEFCFSIPAKGDWAYFSSGDYKTSDLYRIRVPKEIQPEPVTVISARIVDKETNKPIAPTSPASPATPTNPSQPSNTYTIIVPQDKKSTHSQPQVPGYYVSGPDLEKTGKAYEEIDYDGNDPKILQQNAASAPPVDKTALAKSQKEVDDLKNKLARLQGDVKQLETQRTPLNAPTNQPIANNPKPTTPPNRPNQGSNEVSRTGNNQPITQNQQPKTNPSAPVDPELEKLKARYNQSTQPTTSIQPPANNQQPTINPQPLTINQNPIANNQQPKPSSSAPVDPELEKLRARYNQSTQPTTTNQPPANNQQPTINPQPSTINQNPIANNQQPKPNPSAPVDPELEKLRARYNQSTQPTTSNQPPANNQQPTINPQPLTTDNSQPTNNQDPRIENQDPVTYTRVEQPWKPGDSKPPANGEYNGSYPAGEGHNNWQNNPNGGEGHNTYNNQPNGGEGHNNWQNNPNGGEGHNNWKNNPNGGEGHNNWQNNPNGGEGHNTYNNQPNGGEGHNNWQNNPNGGEGHNAYNNQPNGGQGNGNYSNPPMPGEVRRQQPQGNPNSGDYAPGNQQKPQTSPDYFGSRKETAQPNSPPIDRVAIEAEVRREVEAKLKDEVRRDLQKSMLEEVRTDLAKDLTPDMEDQLRKDLEDKVAQNLRKELSEGVQNEMRNEMRNTVADELREKLRADIEKQLRDQMRDNIRQDLRTQMQDEVREALRKEMEYQIKRELETQLRRELETKIRQQIAEQERDRNRPEGGAINGTPASKPLPEYREITADIEAVPIKVGQVIPMNNIFFDANKTSLKEESFAELSKVLEFLKAQDKLVVEIGGHTNGMCSDQFAEPLSTDRAKAVRDYLVGNGIPSNRIHFKGYGKALPVASNETTEGRKKNQRVEMKILQIVD